MNQRKGESLFQANNKCELLFLVCIDESRFFLLLVDVVVGAISLVLTLLPSSM
jgi:hypothetical protein